MGQKVNPHGMRVGVIKDWDSRWYARDEKVGDLIVEDNKIRKFVKKSLYGAGVPKIEIERSNDVVTLFVHCARPGMVIGKDGAEPVAIDKIENKHIIGLMRVVKAYEKYTVEAATTGSEAAAINALLVHPLVGDWERAHKCFEEMKWAHKAYLPEFFPNDVVIKC